MLVRYYDENALLESSGITLLFNLILSVNINLVNKFVLHHRFSATLVVPNLVILSHSKFYFTFNVFNWSPIPVYSYNPVGVTSPISLGVRIPPLTLSKFFIIEHLPDRQDTPRLEFT